MKTNFTGSALFTFLLFNTFVCVSQSPPPPGISWKRSDRIQEYPPFVHVPVTQELKMASEDWWYDHKNSYENGIVDPAKFNGFITCGYSQYRNIEFEEQNGCEQQELGTDLTHCNDELDFTNFNPGRYNAHSFQTIARFDVFGNMLWYKTYNRTWFSRIIQTADGNYIAVGPTQSSEDLYNQVPIYYNPGQNGNSNAFGYNGLPCFPARNRKVNVVKIDPNGNIIWSYLYGVRDISVSGFALDNHIAWDLVEFDGGARIRVVGGVELSGTPVNQKSAFLIDLRSADGNFIDAETFSPLNTTTAFNDRTWFAIEKKTISGIDYLAVVGNESMSATSETKLNVAYFTGTNTTPIWNEYYQFGNSSSINYSSDICFDTNNDLLVPVVFNCSNCNYGDSKGEAKVVRIDPANPLPTTFTYYPVSDGTAPSDLVHAYDLKMGITNTSDGGFAIVTSKVINEFNSVHTPVSWNCDFTQYTSSMGELTYWNADAFVRKWDAAGNIEWTKDFDIDEKAPEAFPGDQKRQECMYSISETPDNGFVVSGNNSRNFDDCYLVKLYSNCNNEVVYDYKSESQDGILTITELGTNVLSGNYKIKGSIVVGNQEQLTISGSSTIIEFADTRQCGIPTNIIVEKGGLLTITEGAKLTAISDCELSMWDGIQLWGNSTAPQTGSDQPGVFIDAQSTIENARYGILADKADYVTHEKNIDDYQCKIKDLAMAETQSYGGGYVYCSDANFRNNRFSVVLNSYTQNNESVIMNSNFFLDEPIHDFDVVNEMGFRKGINSFIKLFDVFRNPGGLIITENNFDILSGILQSPDDYGKGISAFNSTFQASSNTFDNLNFGLISGASNTLNTFSFKCNTLTNMIHGAHISGIDYFQMHTNDFQITNEAHPYGIYMENCTGYMLEQNTLSFNSSNWNRNPAGLINYIATANNNVNEIRNNTISNFKYGMVIEGENRSNFNYDVGLKLWCNSLENYEYAIAVTHPPGIAGIQDGPASTTGANNLFESYGCNFSNEGELYNPAGNNPFNYIHKQDNGGFFVEPITGCYTNSPIGQVGPQNLLTPFIYSIDCYATSLDCSPVLRTVNPLTSNSNNTSILKNKKDSINAPLSELNINKKIRFYLHDSGISNPEDSIISLIQTSNSNGREYLLAFAYAKSGRDSNLAAQLNSLNNDSIYAGLNSIATITDSVNWNELRNDVSGKANLTVIAMDSSKYACTAARNILRNVYDEFFPEIIILPSTAIAQPRIARNRDDSGVKIYPNPFTTEINIEFANFDDFYVLKVYDIIGKELMNISIKGNNINTINFSDWPSGLYLLNIISNTSLIFSEKINHVSQ